MKLAGVVLYVLWFVVSVAALAVRHEGRNLGPRREVHELLLLAAFDTVLAILLFARR